MSDPFITTLQIGGALVLCYSALMVGRAIAARIAGDKASLVLGVALISLSLPLPYPRRIENDYENETETDNTTTPGNTGEHGETVELLEINSHVGQLVTPRMTSDERAELMQVRHEAIALLDRCVRYYRETGAVDDGIIPRYDVIKMKSEYRGLICKNLEYSGFVSIVKGNKTFVVMEHEGTSLGSCEVLMKLIIANRKRVYPVGYAERKQKLLDSAVNALPGIER